MGLFGDFEFKLADNIDLDLLLKIDAHIEANVMVATNSLVENLTLKFPGGGAAGLLLNVAGAVGGHLRHKELIGRLDRLEKKLDEILNKLVGIETDLRHIQALLYETMQRVHHIQTLALTDPVRNSAARLSALVLKVKQDWPSWQGGSHSEVVKATREEIRLELNLITGSEYFQFFPLVASGIVALRDLSELADDNWDPKPALKDYLSYFERAIRPFSERDEETPEINDSFPQLMEDHKRAADFILSPALSLPDIKWSYPIRRPLTFEFPIGGATFPLGDGWSMVGGTKFKGPSPKDAYVWECRLSPNQFFVPIFDKVKPNWKRMNFVKVPDMKVLFKAPGSRDAKELNGYWRLSGDYRVFALAEIDGTTIKHVGNFYHPRDISRPWPMILLKADEIVQGGRGLLASEIPDAEDYAEANRLSSQHIEATEDREFPVLGSNRRVEGIETALNEASGHLDAAATAAEAMIAIQLLIRELRSIVES